MKPFQPARETDGVHSPAPRSLEERLRALQESDQTSATAISVPERTGRLRFLTSFRACLILSMIAILFLGVAGALAQTAQSPRCNICSIPDQIAWHNGTNQFLVHWDNAPSVTFAVAAYPQPVGVISLAPADGSNWVYRYVPAAADRTSFTVTLTATLGGQTTAQSFTTTPQPSLPPEQSVYGTDQHTQPLISTYGTKVFDRESLGNEVLNYRTGKVHSVRIVGETVVIERNNANGLYEIYFNTDENLARRDLKTMEIFAEQVVIRSPVRLKQTDVSISARELRFEQDGQIKTTPHEITTSPGFTLSGGLPGVDGLRAGNVTLNVGNLYSETADAKLDLTGGKGQPGGPGEDGVNGVSLGTCWSGKTVCDSGDCSTYTAPAGWCLIYWAHYFDGIFTMDGGEGGWPTSGTDAKPSGKPGEGGAGGSLLANQAQQSEATWSGGACGQPAKAGYWYWGGYAGWPTKSKKVKFETHFYLVYWYVDNHEIGSVETKSGTNAPVKQANAATGPMGSFTPVGGTYTWLNPQVLRKIVDHAKDDHLGNRISQAEARFKDYAQILENYMADTASWGALNATTQFELKQTYNEIQLSLQQIANGLDYYGNPAGWVPMLSFEVTQAMYATEIDRAINMLYLSYWINNKAATEQQKVAALSAAREKLRQELSQAKPDYDAAVARLPVLNNKAVTLNNKITETQYALQAKELELMQQVRDPSWMLGVRIGLKFSAMICQMVPVYQPALGAAGEGMRLVSDMDPDKPWDTIFAGAGLAGTYLNSDFEGASQDQKTVKDTIDPSQVETKGFDYLGAMQTASAGLSAGLADIRKFAAKQQAPSADMLAELEHLKSLSPECKELVQRIEAFHQEKRQFADELVSTMQQVASLSDLITRDMLAIDGMNKQVAAGSLVLDERATSYLADMERRAYDRLLKYHYYLAKAYEYRLLRPYTEPLNLQGLIQKFQEIAALNADHQITPEQFAAFKGVFQEKLALVAETIFDEYNAHRPELSVPIRFSLTTNELARLNNNETVALNMMDEGWFFPDEENVRIVNLRIYSITTETASGTYGNPAYVDVTISHSGISKTKKDGAVHQFRHYNRQTENPITWGGRYDPNDNIIDPKQPSAASDSLLRSLLSTPAQSDMLLYSSPSAWADLQISRKYLNVGGQPIKIKSLRLEVQYDYTPRNEVLGRKDLEVLVSTAMRNPQGQTVVEESTLMPYFLVSAADNSGRPDFNSRQDAKGRFLRIYAQNQQPVRITAQKEYGTMGFYKWTYRDGSDLPGGPRTNPTIDLVPQADQAITAQYVPLADIPMVLNKPAQTAGSVILSWNGGIRTRVQKSTSLKNPVWEDVPGTEGRSTIELPKTGDAAFFRLIRR